MAEDFMIYNKREIATVPRSVPEGIDHPIYGIPFKNSYDLMVKAVADTVSGDNCSAFVYTVPNINKQLYDDTHLFVTGRRKIIKNLIGEIVSVSEKDVRIAIMNKYNFVKYKYPLLVMDLDFDEEIYDNNYIHIKKINGFYITEQYE